MEKLIIRNTLNRLEYLERNWHKQILYTYVYVYV